MIKKLIERRRRVLYRRAMMDAIEEARMSTLTSDLARRIERKPSRSDARRAIRAFERTNGFRFDPFDSSHRMKIAVITARARDLGRMLDEMDPWMAPGLRLEPQLQR